MFIGSHTHTCIMVSFIISHVVCSDRSLEIVFDHVYTLKGIDVYRYVVPSFVFANVSVNPSNKGFCTPANNCLPGGLLNASTCKDGKARFQLSSFS